MEFGKRLAELMGKANLTKYALAKESGVSYSFISELEHGVSKKPSPPILAKLAGALGVSYESLMVDAGYPPPESLGDLPDWLKLMPKEMQNFIAEESKKGWPYIRVLLDASARGLSPENLRQIVLALADFAQKQSEKDRN